ncbi:Tetraspanin-7 [Hibiscus syriacus]|uniref:Tetraspanin-7 n=1 Tax=Hibiscus syriacus TaxID=106335 RepID=A0A6A3BTI1_HIBSY|nr:Tetraspanin-7 [Hibiscus syriacus]
MAFRLSNNLLGILNFMTFLLSILGAGIWLSREGLTECKHFLDRPIYVGVFLMAVSLAGMIGACCRVTWLLWLYVVVMFLLIVLGVVFTVFAFVVTNKGAGETLPGRGYKEYRLGDYSNWLQKRVSDGKNWNKIKSCLADSKVCTDFNDKYLNVPVTEFYREHLSSVQTTVNSSTSDRLTGLEGVPYPPTPTAACGIITWTHSTSTASHARPDSWTTYGVLGRRWRSSTSCASSSSSSTTPLAAALSGTIGETIIISNHGSLEVVVFGLRWALVGYTLPDLLLFSALWFSVYDLHI